jgi:hypothetical protein
MYISCSAAAACSHTAAMLFGIGEFISHGFQELPDGPTTTEKLAYWINPKGINTLHYKLLKAMLLSIGFLFHLFSFSSAFNYIEFVFVVNQFRSFFSCAEITK